MSRSLNLGLEALTVVPGRTGNTVVIDLVDAIVRVNTVSDEIQYEVFNGERIATAVENLCAIERALETNVSMAALEALIGPGHWSIESVGSKLKGGFDAVIAWFKRIFELIKRFFVELFNRNQKWTRVLTDEKARITGLIRGKDGRKIDTDKLANMDDVQIHVVPSIPTPLGADEWLKKEHPTDTVSVSNINNVLQYLDHAIKGLESCKQLRAQAEAQFAEAIRVATQTLNTATTDRGKATAAKALADQQQNKKTYAEALKLYGAFVQRAASDALKLSRSVPTKASGKK